MLKINIQSKQIGEHTFYARPFNPMMALSLLGDLQTVVTSSLNLSETEEGKTDVNLGSLIAGIGSKLNGPALLGFADRILNPDYVSVDIITDRGKDTVKLDKLRQEELFTGHMKDMLVLMWFVLEVNYSDFFDLLPSVPGVQLLKDQK